ncbi:MAG: hypothetical protein CMC13_04265 [Flavobacteriaceae bacterium]|nr:hypothetical protein [Flavobacteriaceae bacterium]|tara:strand:+ start:2842 stop:3411 length:570 start_codon:yes stop_codon:yes gene_type:complete
MNTQVTIMKRLGLLITLFCFTQLGISQTYIGSNTNNTVPKAQDIEDEIVIDNEKVTPEFLSALGIGTTPNPRNATIEGNQVFLNQIGDYNEAQVRTRTKASEINIEQRGNSNFSSLNYTANTAIADILQNGNNNQLKDFVNKPGEDISIDLIQEGNSLNFERNGANNLTRSIQFRQTESTPNLIIRSFF